jgi:threonine aldolase
MYQYSFQNDYSEGAHPRIIEALARTNFDQEAGYGEDRFCAEATQQILRAIGNPQAAVHFISGGTQTNLLMLSSFLRPYESVIAVETGHICVHETGSVEATGHKVNTTPGYDGKVIASEIEATVAAHNDEHMVKPRAVYISHPTELGTIYSARELREISAVCKRLNLILYMDGARLGTALTSETSDLSLQEISSLVDAFYIGGTKNGALLGEALVINNPALQPEFRYMIKQKGALLSKGRILGIQFLELFKDDLYFELARNANRMAQKLARGIAALGYSFQIQSPTNQIFPIFSDAVIDALSREYRFYTWARVDSNHASVRLVTSWATPDSAVDGFLTDLKAITK